MQRKITTVLVLSLWLALCVVSQALAACFVIQYGPKYIGSIFASVLVLVLFANAILDIIFGTKTIRRYL